MEQLSERLETGSYQLLPDSAGVVAKVMKFVGDRGGGELARCMFVQHS